MKLRALIAIILVLSLSVAFSVLAFAQKTGAPKLVVAKADHDFGKVIEGKAVSHIFKLRNEGTADLVIKNVSPACGCTASDFTKVIPAGGEGTVTLTVKTEGMNGKQSRYADVISNDGKSPNFQLWLHLDVQKQ